MCGLVGVFGNICNPDEKTFKTLLTLSGLRGPHSTGVAFGTGKGDVSLIKSAETPYTFIDSKDMKVDLFSTWNKNAFVMGHNRWATVGAVTSDNAHPFLHTKGDRSVVVAHNGRFDNFYELSKASYETDSEHVVDTFLEHSKAETLLKVEGAFALTWYDTADNTFNIARNDQRPMALAKVKGRNTWFYASEADMLEYAAKREGTNLCDIGILDVGMLLSYKLGEAAYTITKVALAPTHNYSHYPVSKGHSWQNYYQKQAEVFTPSTLPKQFNDKSVREYNKGASFLEERGLSKGSVLLATLDKWEAYENAKKSGLLTLRGKATGVLRGTEGAKVKVAVHNVECDIYMDGQETLDDFLSSDYVVRITDCYYDNQQKLYMMVCSLVREATDHDLTHIAVLERPKPESLPTLIKSFGNTYVNRTTWNKLTARGCVSCTANLHEDESDKMAWIDSDSPLCPDCSKKWLMGALHLCAA